MNAKFPLWFHIKPCRGKGFPTNLPTNGIKWPEMRKKQITQIVKQIPVNPLQYKRFTGIS